MMFRTHLVFGFLVWLFVLKFFQLGNNYLFLVLVLIGSVLPDIDETKSKVGRQFGFISSLIEFIFKHRGIFHSVFLALALLALFLFFGLGELGFGLFIGYIMHIVLDSLTLAGVRIFYPVSDFRVSGFIKTGGFLEGVFFVILMLVVVVILI